MTKDEKFKKERADRNEAIRKDYESKRAYVEAVRQKLADRDLTAQERLQAGQRLERIYREIAADNSWIYRELAADNRSEPPVTLWTDAQLQKMVDNIMAYYTCSWENDEGLNFKKVMQRQISLKAKPMAKQYGMKPGKRNTFVLERDGLVFHWEFYFRHSTEVSDLFKIVPIYAPLKGAFGEGLPFGEQYGYLTSRNFVTCSELKYFVSESEKEEVIKEFDVALAQTAGKLHYCNEMDSFEKYIAQVHQNIEEMHRLRLLPLELDGYGKYILGVYDCLHQRYDEGGEKVKQALDEFVCCDDEKYLQWLSELTLDEIGSNDRWTTALYYKFLEMFVQALDKPSSEREECFKKTYEIVCNKMRKFYGIKVS